MAPVGVREDDAELVVGEVRRLEVGACEEVVGVDEGEVEVIEGLALCEADELDAVGLALEVGVVMEEVDVVAASVVVSVSVSVEVSVSVDVEVSVDSVVVVAVASVLVVVSTVVVVVSSAVVVVVGASVLSVVVAVDVSVGDTATGVGREV